MPHCPVCGVRIDEDLITNDSYGDEATEYGDTVFETPNAKYGDREYYFCSSEHESAFRDDPDRYV